MFDYSENASAAYAQFSLERWESFFSEKVTARKQIVEGYLRFIKNLSERELPPIFEERHLALLLGISLKQLRYYSSGSASLYRTFDIPKRSGGSRVISAPVNTLAHIQRWLDFNIFRKFPVSDSAYGYVEGRSNRDNAIQHIGRECLLHTDLADFFHAIQTEDISRVLSLAGYPPTICSIISRLCSHHGYLAQGAPSSPQIANVCFKETDDELQIFAEKLDLIYTRYVDDMTFSGNAEVLKSQKKSIEEICKNRGFFVNSRKTFVQEGQKKVVTGIAIGSGVPKLPRGRKRRFAFEIFATIRNLELRKPLLDDPLLVERTRGLLAYWLYVEPHNRQALRLSERFRASLKLEH